MEKVFLIGDNEHLISELSDLLKDKYEIADQVDPSVEIIFDLTTNNKDVKFNILNFIDEKNSKAVVISSSVCIPVLEQAVVSKFPERLVGAAMYPGFTSGKAVEIARSKFTSEETFSKAEEIFSKLDKRVIESPDRPGMLALRIISLIINEAYLVMQEGTSERDDIDTAMKLGTNYPYGPIEWSEKIGIDTVYSVLRSMHDEYGDDRYRITPLLKETYLESQI